MKLEYGSGRKISLAVQSTTLKVIILGGLVLGLLIPVFMIKRLIQEREMRQEEVVYEIGSKWGAAQTIGGPILTIPFRQPGPLSSGDTVRKTGYIHILPDLLNVSGAVTPHTRYRGIYETVLFHTQLKLSGTFSHPAFADLGVGTHDILWDRAFVSVGISDLTGVKENVHVKVDGETLPMNPGIESSDVLHSGMSAKVPGAKERRTMSFETTISLNGRESLSFLPVGKETTVSLESTWPDPSFDGVYLPASRTVTENGFRAKWRVLHVNRDYPQYWTGDQHDIEPSAFGARLFLPVDAYQKSTRTAKYAILFIGLTFAAFFLSEVVKKQTVHPVQYLLVGLALVIFYTLLISISEHLGFNKAYALSSVATVGLVTWYSRSVLKRRLLSLMVGGLLVVLYGYLFMTLQADNYALLLGSIGLFVTLGVVMFLTRKIDWYRTPDGPGGKEPTNGPGAAPEGRNQNSKFEYRNTKQ